MRESLTFATSELTPEPDAVLTGQGIPRGAELSGRVQQLVADAMELFASLAEGRGVWEEIGKSDFAEVFQGDGHNESPSPLEEIYPRADRLALFAVTLGETLCREISGLVDGGKLALGYLLDAVASEAAENAATLAARHYLAAQTDAGTASPAIGILPYSPGYCGWHVSGQRRLFERLHPEEIGISLNPSCLMSPLKSISGVLVVGEGKIHEFVNRFDFCKRCGTLQCRERIASMRKATVNTRRESWDGNP
ncbi:MAG: hypothetical protein GY856_34150 [bacterium]|nr:hypothetical protein [bacterium]